MLGKPFFITARCDGEKLGIKCPDYALDEDCLSNDICKGATITVLKQVADIPTETPQCNCGADNKHGQKRKLRGLN